MSPQDRTITVRLFQIFEEIVEQKQLEEEAKLEIYKQIELERIPDVMAHVDWNNTAVDVAGQLMSTLILKHALPNANTELKSVLLSGIWRASKPDFHFLTLQPKRTTGRRGSTNTLPNRSDFSR